ncbi:MAG: hypothetical protein HYU86_10345 [Chloroflexi bacterium]|nr:hypothetical protein [Chloroflexota bacterium]
MKDTESISHLHDLARQLIELGELLQTLPNTELKAGKELSGAAPKKKSPRRRSFLSLRDTDVEKLALEIKNLSQEEAYERLDEFSVPQLVDLAERMSIRTSSKARKEEIIGRLLRPLFDFEEGQGVMKRFHERAAMKEEQASFEDDLQFYEEHLAQFLSEYKGRYIALLNRQVVDSDANFSRLAERVYGKFGYRDICMPKVEEPRVVSMPSPRLVGRP